ncbi:hypothetical protein SteCoe_21678 [Stentor coeruleus]|uniref:C2H2-type domain-containing protein n=1 Tax=Stentor coeruleus TaxID=5963 RepID=A0A1R2BNY1_9CILI|nr:hypothetical protein SteCoe_21678 [Stentor coeruleus]
MTRKRITCDYEGCTRSYCSSFNLKRHIESAHFGLRKFKCPMCARLLSSKQNLLDHQNIHTGAKPYSCDIPGCNLQFRQLSQYYLHKQLHNEVSNHLNNGLTKIDFNISLLVGKLSQCQLETSYSSPLLPYTYCELPLISNTCDIVELPVPEILMKGLNE